jgi:MFS family permease
VFAARVQHNGWLWYQGGDQTFFYTTSWLLNDGEIPRTPIGYVWPYVLAPLGFGSGPSLLDALPAIVIFNVAVLAPLALLCVYGLASRIAGRALGLAAAVLWVVLPFLAIPLWVERYHDRYVEQVLPQALGLTAMADFPSMVAVLAAAYCCFRALDERDRRWAALGGLAAGLAAGLKPANLLFLAAPALIFLAWRHARPLTLPFATALVPGLLALAAWKVKGLGSLPVAIRHDAQLAAVVAAGPLDRYGGIDLTRLDHNLDALREFFWTVRLLEWAAIAGVIAIARWSGAKAAFLAVWLAAFVLVKGGTEQSSVDTGSFFRLLQPAFPALFLLVVALPLLVPTFGARLHAPRIGSWSPRWQRTAIAVAVIAVAQLVTIPLLAEPAAGKAVEEKVSRVFVPVDKRLAPTASTEGRDVRLTWPAFGTGSSTVFYRVLRSAPTETEEGDPNTPPAQDGVRCETAIRGSPRCELAMTTVGLARGRAWIDRAPTGTWVYRIGLSANWADDVLLGDLLLLSAPITVTVP